MLSIVLNRYATCAAVSVLAIVSALLYAQGTAALLKLGEVVLTLGGLVVAVLALIFLQEAATAHRAKIIKIVDAHAIGIAFFVSSMLGGIIMMGWYLAATSIIGKRTGPIVTLDQSALFLVTSAIGGFCLSGFIVRNFPAEDKLACRMMFGAMATLFISLLVFTIAATGGA
jgi:archaellum biogenesis protein FlaJ (TadC family)